MSVAEVFLICPHVHSHVIHVILERGGQITRHYTDQVTYGLVGWCCLVTNNETDMRNCGNVNDNKFEYRSEEEGDDAENKENRQEQQKSFTSSVMSMPNVYCRKSMCKVFPNIELVRANRITVLHETYITSQTIEDITQHVGNMKKNFIIYDPFLFSNVEFTTTHLPYMIKENVIGALQFMGAVYSPHLTIRTSLLVYCKLFLHNEHATQLHPLQKEINNNNNDNKLYSTLCKFTQKEYEQEEQEYHDDKLIVALQRGVLCVTPSWVQESVRSGQLSLLNLTCDNTLFNKALMHNNDINTHQSCSSLNEAESKESVMQRKPENLIKENREEKRKDESLQNEECNVDVEHIVNKLLRQELITSRRKYCKSNKAKCIAINNKNKNNQGRHNVVIHKKVLS